MLLDFFTLYVTIVLVAFALAIVWASIASRYRDFAAGWLWCAACGLIAAGGALLPFQHMVAFPILPAILGNGTILLGFWLLWSGLRRFNGQSQGWPMIAAFTTLSVLLTAVFFGNEGAISIVYALGQSVPMALSIGLVLCGSRRAAGAWLTCAGIGVGLAGHAVVTGMNIGILLGVFPTDGASPIAAATMLGVIFCGILWNFGFAVMTIERLRNDVVELSNLDPLTGLWNRRKFDQELALANARSARGGRPYALLLLDLDHFKAVNDQLGHKGGDTYLRHFAAIARTCLGETGLMMRLGGDEFCIIVPDSSAPEARALGKRILESFAAHPMHYGGRELPLSCSIGASIWSRQTADDPDAVFCRADKALYSVKSEGRNGFSLLPPPLKRVAAPPPARQARSRMAKA
ncbi:GGDEF domain-containing protein [Devosia sp.]|uniref:GGDEF domain-containing protein n=1 Tax=Devosia sp. TaxID=1871048 RepID=UPI002AFF5453|nr:GGDEF domain-containing protein [Devosia sp.]